MTRSASTVRAGACVGCGGQMVDHFDHTNGYVGCSPLSPMTVALDGVVYMLRTTADVYRLAAIDRRRRAHLAPELLQRPEAVDGAVDGAGELAQVTTAIQVAPQRADCGIGVGLGFGLRN